MNLIVFVNKVALCLIVLCPYFVKSCQNKQKQNQLNQVPGATQKPCKKPNEPDNQYYPDYQGPPYPDYPGYQPHPHPGQPGPPGRPRRVPRPGQARQPGPGTPRPGRPPPGYPGGPGNQHPPYYPNYPEERPNNRPPRPSRPPPAYQYDYYDDTYDVQPQKGYAIGTMKNMMTNGVMSNTWNIQGHHLDYDDYYERNMLGRDRYYNQRQQQRGRIKGRHYLKQLSGKNPVQMLSGVVTKKKKKKSKKIIKKNKGHSTRQICLVTKLSNICVRRFDRRKLGLI